MPDILDTISTSEINYKLLDWFLIEHREMNEPLARERLVQALIRRQCFYVPFDRYLSKVFGSTAVSAFSEFYSNGHCGLTGSLVMPLKTLEGDVLGYLRNNPKSLDKYHYPEKYNFMKTRFIQSTKESFDIGFKEQYMCVVEGVFDEIAVSSLGLPCSGLSGSEMTYNLVFMLDIFPTKLIISDNDSGGDKLFQQCIKRLSGKVIYVKVPTRDVDKYLRNEANAEKLKRVIETNKQNGFPFYVIEV